ncbi:MAG TPA: Rid family detoxifying hydrolase [Pyrinomonadaceae bacterium]|jgi:2-iminobutanoate/2-iminopropanoate deaminase
MRNSLKFAIAASVVSLGCASVYGQAAGSKTERRIVKLPGSPPAAPISPAIVVGDLVFTSGQIGIDPKTGQMVEGGLEEQAEQVLKNLAAVLEAAGSSMAHVVKATVFLADMNDYAAMNQIYRNHFKQDFPARSAVQVAKLPANARIEIEAVAVLKKN